MTPYLHSISTSSCEARLLELPSTLLQKIGTLEDEDWRGAWNLHIFKNMFETVRYSRGVRIFIVIPNNVLVLIVILILIPRTGASGHQCPQNIPPIQSTLRSMGNWYLVENVLLWNVGTDIFIIFQSGVVMKAFWKKQFQRAINFVLRWFQVSQERILAYLGVSMRAREPKSLYRTVPYLHVHLNYKGLDRCLNHDIV